MVNGLQLPAEIAGFVSERMATGDYRDERDVLLEALYALREQYIVESRTVEDIKREVAVGLEQEAQGRYGPIDIPAIMARVRERHARGQKSS